MWPVFAIRAVTAFTIILVVTSTVGESAVVQYTFSVSYITGSPDGVHKNTILGINGQFPGPTIESFVGDTVEITVVNKIQDFQNVSLHWHGIDQKGSIFQDGTSQIAQCPLPYGSFQVYQYNVTRRGTYWYHSHVNSQYTEGLFGALIVHDLNEPYTYDGELTLLLHDWYHRSYQENQNWFLSPASDGNPYPDSALINGFGFYPCDLAALQNRTCSQDLQRRPVLTVQQNATYRVRVVNTAALTFFNFSIDGHILEVIEVDGVDVAQPTPVDVAQLAPGQRYSFRVHPVQDLTDFEQIFLIRSVTQKQLLRCTPNNINQYCENPRAMPDTVTAVFRRVLQDLGDEPKLVKETAEIFFDYDNLPPPVYYNRTGEDIIHLNQMGLSPLEGGPAPGNVDEEHFVESFLSRDSNGPRSGFNNISFSLPHGDPLLFTFVEDGELPDGFLALDVQLGGVVQIVIYNPLGTHPFHLHGHHFWVVGVGNPDDGPYNKYVHELTLNGVKRDTVICQSNSWVVIRFVTDNPGLWTLHCHMDWHNLSGMALLIVEGSDFFKAEKMMPPDEAIRICNLHKTRFGTSFK